MLKEITTEECLCSICVFQNFGNVLIGRSLFAYRTLAAKESGRCSFSLSKVSEGVRMDTIQYVKKLKKKKKLAYVSPFLSFYAKSEINCSEVKS